MASFGLQGKAGLLIVLRAALHVVVAAARHIALLERSLIVHPDRKPGGPEWKHRRGENDGRYPRLHQQGMAGKGSQHQFAGLFGPFLPYFSPAFRCGFCELNYTGSRRI